MGYLQALPAVKDLRQKADQAWDVFVMLTAQRPVRGNDWKRFLTWDEDEEVPENWDASTLPAFWGKGVMRMKVSLNVRLGMRHDTHTHHAQSTVLSNLRQV